MFKKLTTSFLWLSSLPICMYTLITYLLSYTLIIEHWSAGFIMMSMPIAIFACFFIAVMWLFIRPSRAILPCIVLIIGYPFIQRTITFHDKNAPSKGDISVLNFNLYGLHAGMWEEKGILKLTNDCIDFISNYDADIECFQEFYNSQYIKGFQTIRMMKKSHPYAAIAQRHGADANEGVIGVAIFSRYPIIYKEYKKFEQANNGYLVADIKIKDDTIRVINMQLWSMGIRVGRVVGQMKDNDYTDAKREGRGIIASLKKGFERHRDEIASISRVINNSPYPVILCGDFNETPYGLAYGTVRDRLKNSFEEAGKGFGFTLNRSPKWVRIDNQFFSKELDITSFKTHSEIPYSDHYPIFSSYKLKNKRQPSM